MTQVHTFECGGCGWTEHKVSQSAGEQMDVSCPRCGESMSVTQVG